MYYLFYSFAKIEVFRDKNWDFQHLFLLCVTFNGHLILTSFEMLLIHLVNIQ